MNPSAMLSDARWTGCHGIGRFAREVLRRLPEHTQLDHGPKPLSLADPFWLSGQVMARRPAVFFSPGFNPPPLCRAPFVFTIHDLMQVQTPDEVTAVKRLYYGLVVKPACRRAYRVLTVSEYSRSQILEWSGVPEDRVENVGNGVDLPFQPEGRRYEPGFLYVLYVGNSRPHKNLQRFFHAFREVKYPGLRLVLAGCDCQEVVRSLNQVGIRNRTTIINATDDELAGVYRGAQLLVLPSLVEGFGLPALEAMACGAPVAASRAAAVPEVVGGAAVLFDPLDIADMTHAMEGVLGSPERQAVMRALGIRRARQFSWDKVASKVQAVLEEAAGGSWRTLERAAGDFRSPRRLSAG